MRQANVLNFMAQLLNGKEPEASYNDSIWRKCLGDHVPGAPEYLPLNSSLQSQADFIKLTWSFFSIFVKFS